MQHVIIIGAGQAGAGAALGLREFGFTGAITLIGDEAVPPYERPELSKAYAKGDTAFDNLVILTPERAQEMQIDLRLSESVTQLDINAKTITTTNGQLDYSHLIFATGGQARTLPLPDQLSEVSHVIRSKADADGLRDAMKTSKTAVVIGGGWLGLEMASTCRSLGLDVHVIEVADRLCARVAPQWLSEQLAQLQKADGVQLHLGQVPEFNAATVQIGELEITPDLVVQAVGLRANDALAEQAGLACSDGIEVDGYFQTANASVFAIGDCARDMSTGGIRQESWQNANVSAQKVAAIIAGTELPQSPQPWFWSNQAGMNIQMLGNCHEDHRQVSCPDPKTGGTIRYFLEGSTLAGCIALNAARSLGMARRFVGSQTQFDLEKLADPSLAIGKCTI